MPTLEFALLADEAKTENGKLSLVGEFSTVRAAKLPARHPHLTVVARWSAPTPDVTSPQSLQIDLLGPSGKAMGKRSPPTELVFNPIGDLRPGFSESNLLIAVDNLVFREHGVHWFRFFINDAPVGKVGLVVTGPVAPEVANVSS